MWHYTAEKKHKFVGTKEQTIESSVIIAIVTAIVSIIVAFIQATALLRVTRLKEPPVQSSGVSVQPGTPVKTLSANHTWLWIARKTKTILPCQHVKTFAGSVYYFVKPSLECIRVVKGYSP